MSWFILNPPPGVTVVSFFVTARLAGQDDSATYATAVAGQLEELLGQDLPEPAATTGLTSRYWFLLRALAHLLEQRGQRLVLVVDGLDEDRGAGRGMPSIASMLPKHCEHGLKVIVASRPNPEIPPDVAADHPLRSQHYVRTLNRSAHAQIIRDAAEFELREFLNGTQVQQDLLGLLTAARGGLTRADLAELTALEPFKVRQMLQGVEGRTFTTSVTAWSSGENAEKVYLLAHETLQAEATAALGEKRLSGYRAQLIHWAETYQVNKWPEGAPVYLLYGYFRMLYSVGDITRIVACATDPARHDRMLSLTGGDVAARIEIAAATDMILAQPNPDLIAMASIAFHRDSLNRRNQPMPYDLPAVWAAVGQPERAEALARSITESADRARALIQVAEALAARMPDRAEEIARSATTEHIWQPQRALVALVRALIVSGQLDRAETVADSISEPEQQAEALGLLAKAFAAAGLHDRAKHMADRVESIDLSDDPRGQTEALTLAAKALAACGMIKRAKTMIRSLRWVGLRPAAYAALAKPLAAAGQEKKAIQIVTEAEAMARSIANSYRESEALRLLVPALIAAGMHDRAEAVAESITRPVDRAAALNSVAKALVVAGLKVRALRAANQAHSISQSITDADDKVSALIGVAEALAVIGLHERAIRIVLPLEKPVLLAEPLAYVARELASVGQARQAEAVADLISSPEARSKALAWVARQLVAVGLHEQAAQVAGRAEIVARSIERPIELAGLLADLTKALGAASLHKLAAQVASDTEILARSIAGPEERPRALASAAGALAAAGLTKQARQVASEAAALAGSTKPHTRKWALIEVAEALVTAGRPEQAETIARSNVTADDEVAIVALVRALASGGLYEQAEVIANSLADPIDQSRALTAMAKALAAAGLYERAGQLAGQAETVANSISNEYIRADSLAEVAGALAASRLPDRAKALARSIWEPEAQAETSIATATALAVAGRYDEAEALARSIGIRSIGKPRDRARALSMIVKELADGGRADRAQQMLAVTLSAGPWTVPLRLQVLPPEVLTAMTSLVISDPRSTQVSSTRRNPKPERSQTVASIGLNDMQPDNGGYAHITEKGSIAQVISDQQAMTAICGWTWIPQISRETGDDLSSFPTCPACQQATREKLLRRIVPRYPWSDVPDGVQMLAQSEPTQEERLRAIKALRYMWPKKPENYTDPAYMPLQAAEALVRIAQTADERRQAREILLTAFAGPPSEARSIVARYVVQGVSALAMTAEERQDAREKLLGLVEEPHASVQAEAWALMLKELDPVKGDIKRAIAGLLRVLNETPAVAAEGPALVLAEFDLTDEERQLAREALISKISSAPQWTAKRLARIALRLGATGKEKTIRRALKG